MFNTTLFCFICLSDEDSESNLKEISSNDGTEESIASKLKFIHPDVDPVEENTNKFLCLSCVAELNKSFNFKTKYITGQKNYNFYKNKLSTIVIDDIKNDIKDDIKDEIKDTGHCKDLEFYNELRNDIVSQPDSVNYTQYTLNAIFCNDEEASTFPCYYCSENLISQSALEEHFKLHEKSVENKKEKLVIQKPTMPRRQSKRQICAKTHRVKSTKSSTADKSNITCHVCDIIFKTEENFFKHKCRLFYQCKICLIKFLTRDNLLKHKIRHRKNK